uniref:Uncharacterized protein n=1 Tax=Plectus sambesii TaxID=2011161 RepID=A0A914UVG5_9BILA
MRKLAKHRACNFPVFAEYEDEENDFQSDDGGPVSPTPARRSTSPPVTVMSHLYHRQVSSSATRRPAISSCSSPPVPPYRKKRTTSAQISPVSIGDSAELGVDPALSGISADKRHVTTLTLDCDDTIPGAFTRVNHSGSTEIWSF